MKSTSANALELASPSRTSNADVSGTQTASLVMSELTGLDETRVRTFGSDLAVPVVDVAANRPNLFDCSFHGSAAGLTALTESSDTGSRGSFGGGNGRGGQDDVGRSAVVAPLLVPGRADPSNCCIGFPEFISCGVCEGGQVLRSPSNRRLGTADRVAPYPSSLPKQDSGSSPAFTRYAENMAGDYAKSMTSPKATLPKVLEPPGAPRKKNGKPLETSHRRNLNRAACRRIAF